MTYNNELRRQIRKLDKVNAEINQRNHILLCSNDKLRTQSRELKRKYEKVTDAV
jgi:hypothetical protein